MPTAPTVDQRHDRDFDQLVSHNPGNAVDFRPLDPLRDELEHFAKQYPLLAAQLGAKVPARVEPFPGATFDPGQIAYGLGLAKCGVSQEELRGFVVRHLTGDYGIAGDARSAANAASIAHGYGLVVSRFALWTGDSPAADAAWKSAHHPQDRYPRRKDDILHIITLLSSRGNRTLTIDSRTIQFAP